MPIYLSRNTHIRNVSTGQGSACITSTCVISASYTLVLVSMHLIASFTGLYFYGLEDASLDKVCTCTYSIVLVKTPLKRGPCASRNSDFDWVLLFLSPKKITLLTVRVLIGPLLTQWLTQCN
jgi:hypothetical protein